MPNTLFLALQGPLQAWGERGRWVVRDSADLPTKSGIVGLLGCALGWADDERLVGLSHDIEIGVRADRFGVPLTDYHTIVTGVLSASGGQKGGSETPGTVVSSRDYLCDAAFLVAIRADPDVISRCAAALREPVWPPYLGRKSCPPARPLLDGVGDYVSLQTALEAWPRLVPARKESDTLTAELPAPYGQGMRRKDELSSRQRRTWGVRSVRRVLVNPPDPQEDTPCTSPD